MGKHYMVCAVCNGSRWRLFLVDRKDGRKPQPEVRSCPVCNPDGKLGIGITVEEPFSGKTIADFHKQNGVLTGSRPHGSLQRGADG